MRFAYAISTEGIVQYVSKINWSTTTVFGAFSARGKLIGALELVACGDVMEMAVEVHPEFQNRGVAKALVERGILHARTLGKKELTLTCLGENTPMKQVARATGMTLVNQHGEIESHLPLAPATTSDYIRVGWQDYHAFSANAKALSGWLLSTYFNSLMLGARKPSKESPRASN